MRLKFLVGKISDLIWDRNFLLTIVLGGIFLNFLISAVYVSFGDIYFGGDMARDFLILQEIKEKTFVLLGPRSGAAPGLFHGPIWPYLNYPAFFLGKGNPIAVGWFWVLLNGLFLFTTYLIGKKIMGRLPAAVFALLVSIKMIGLTREFINPTLAAMVLPAFLCSVIYYIQTWKSRYLFVHVFLLGVMIQSQVALGGPFFILSIALVLGLTFIHSRAYRHLLAYLLVPGFLLSYFLFDIRHDFLMIRAVADYLNNSASAHEPWIRLVKNRLGIMWGQGMFMTRGRVSFVNLIAFIVMIGGLGAIIIQMMSLWKKFKVGRKKNTGGGRFKQFLRKENWIVLLLVYFYCGFYVLSLIHGSILAFYYYIPLFPLVFMLFIFALKPYWRGLLGVGLIGLIGVMWFQEVMVLRNDVALIGKRQMSWQFHNHIAEDIFETATELEFGVFIYAPDVHGYRSKYPLVYQDRLHPNLTMFPYEKKAETFLLLQGLPEYPLPWPADPDNFRINSVRINKGFEDAREYNDDYVVERYVLTEEEQMVPFDPHLDNWLHFR